MADEQIIDVTKCIHFDKSDIPNGCTCYWDGECNHYCYYKKYTYKHQECEKLKQTLIEIKPVLELYANSKIGEEQLDGTYKIIVEDSKVLGDMYITFDPRPAKQALQKISGCEVEDAVVSSYYDKSERKESK